MPLHKLKIKKGFDLHAVGRPAAAITSLPDPAQIALVPEYIPHIKPQLLVSEGDVVSIGSPLLQDKRHPRVRFLSPAGGRIGRIGLGPRRVIQSIVIDRTSDEPYLSFPAVPVEAVPAMARDKLVELILAGGMWWAFRQLPFRDWSDPDKTPPLILVALGAKEPFSPQPSIYLDGRQELLEYGLAVLRVLGAGRVVVIAEDGDTMAMNLAAEQATHLVQGRYPADDPGTVLYHIKGSAVDNRAWYISGQDLLLVAALLQQGRYPIERVICVGGRAAAAPRHYRTRLGVPLAHLAGQRQPAQDVRYIVGGMLRGFSGSADGFMGLYETALNILPAEGRAEFLALLRPGLNKPTYSRTFASRLNPAALPFDCLLHGEERACIACLHCTEVCAVDIMPLMAYKALLADEIEEALAHGLLDCVECGLCSYVCPSKIELTQTFIAAKAAYAKDRAE